MGGGVPRQLCTPLSPPTFLSTVPIIKISLQVISSFLCFQNQLQHADVGCLFYFK